MDMSLGLTEVRGIARGEAHRQKKISNDARLPRVVDLGSDPMFLFNIAREFQLIPRDEASDLKRVERAFKHIVWRRSLANVSILLQDIGAAMRDHGFDSRFSRTVRDWANRVQNLRFQDAVFSFLPETGKVPQGTKACCF